MVAFTFGFKARLRAEEGKSGQALTQSQSNKINKMNPDTTIAPT
jgi:hypothetical protein